jgi:LCP family protein required for cell wall assembly
VHDQPEETTLFGLGSGSLIAGKVVYAVVCVTAAVVIVVSGFAHQVVGLTKSLGGGANIGSSSSVGAMNILVMGLESRTDYNGNILSGGLLAAMHAGSVSGVENGTGGQDTNTLILIHIFAGGQKAVGYSIPRDDFVPYAATYDGSSEGKVDEAYGLAYAQSLNSTVNDTSLSHNARYLQANQAGQTAEVATVEEVTGQHIDHFAEVNLAAFYYLAQAFGGIEACIKPSAGDQNLHDANSGFNAVLDGYNTKKGGAQYLHLSAAQALAFVRERDNLPNGDLDRTHRQQAVLDYVIWKLENDGILSSVGKITTLLNTAKGSLITDPEWELLDFASDMHALTGKNLTFYTAPIEAYTTINSQDVNEVSLPAIQASIKAKFDPPPAASASGSAKASAKAAPVPAASTVKVDVYNGGTAAGLATDVMDALVAKGYVQGASANATSQSQTVDPATQVFYGTGASANAAKIAGYFGATAQASGSVTAGHVEVLLGTTATEVPSGLGSSSSGATPSASSSSASAGNGAAGGAVTVSAKAKYGIPCVY